MAAETMTRGATFPRIQWGPVITGVLGALAVQIVLGLFGAAFGFGARPADSKALGVIAGIWEILTPLVATAIGAWIAVRIADAASPRSAYLHGFLVWCIGLIAGAVFLAGAVAGGMMSAGAAVSGNASMRQLQRATTPAGRARAEAVTDEAAKGAAAGMGMAGLASILGLAGAFIGASIGRRELTGQGFGMRGGQRRYAEERGYGRPGEVGGPGGVITTHTTDVRTTQGQEPPLHH